ncbi:MAG: cupin domain-containing protein [Actinomycetes bacterium]
MDANEVIEALELIAHPEGGWFRETWRDDVVDANGRSLGTSIYYMLVAQQHDRWHRVDCDEMWHHYAGAPLELWIAADETSEPVLHLLGTDFAAGQRPQVMVPRGVWRSSVSAGEWSLMSCTDTPGFEPSGWEMAPEDWVPGTSQ